MDPIGEQVGERVVDRALAGDAIEARKSRRLDLHGEMALASRVMAGMAAVQLAVVAHDKMRRSVGLPQPARDFGRPRPGYMIRSEEHPSEIQPLRRLSFTVSGLKKKTRLHTQTTS